MAKVSSSLTGSVYVNGNGLPGNKTDMQKKGDYGVRVARWGYDAGSCEDGDLLFNSSWPIVQIVKYIKPDVSWERVEFAELPGDEPYELKQTVDLDRYNYGVDRKYVYKITGWSSYQYSEIIGHTEWGEDIYRYHIFFKPVAYRYKHGLGYKPMAIGSEILSGGEITDGVILTNVDLDKDADYPYLSKPRVASTKVANYGIASKAYYSGRLNTHNTRYIGLSSNIQSMMVQAVKTSKTSAKNGWGGAFSGAATGSVVYYPPNNGKGQPIFSVGQLSYFGFAGQIAGAIQMEGLGLGGVGEGGGEFVSNLSDDISVGFGSVLFEHMVGLGYGSANIILSKANFADGKEEDEKPRTAAVVCLRCPMVSPELEQVEV